VRVRAAVPKPLIDTLELSSAQTADAASDIAVKAVKVFNFIFPPRNEIILAFRIISTKKQK
jgi:hypothetical protein